jgi:hypothetical protein
MLMTLPLVAALCVTPSQAGGPTLTDARVTYGVLGPTRSGTKFLPGDTLFLTFTIDGIAADPEGKVLYAIGTEVTDSTGKSVFKQPAQDREAINALGGTQMPAFAQVAIGQQMPAGEYTLTVSVTERATKKTQTLNQKFEVVKPDFGLVRVSTSADADGQVPAGVLCAGQSLWVHGAVVGFQRGAAGQPKVAMSLTVKDADGKPTVAKPFGGTIDKNVPPKDVSLPVEFLVSLNRPGKFTVEITATDQGAAGKATTVSFPITVLSAK